jgi:hypothetical protein
VVAHRVDTENPMPEVAMIVATRERMQFVAPTIEASKLAPNP